MPPSLLKFLDIARLLGAGIKCPACKGTLCRASKWISKHERMGADNFRPYRCDDCATRFLAAKNAAMERVMINGAAGILLGLALLMAGDFWLESLDAPKTLREAQASTADSAASTTGNEIQLRSGEAAADTRKDSETPAEKLEKSAERGDSNAMLQLGRDLAVGNNLTKNVEQAAKWIQLAAATGNPEGMFELGRFYRDGVGLAQDSVRAYVWFSRAAAAHHLTATQARDELVRTMSDDKLREAQALTLPVEAAPSPVLRKQ